MHKRASFWLVASLAAALVAPSASAQNVPQVQNQGPSQGKSVDTSGDAVRRSGDATARKPAQPQTYGGGLFLVDEPENDLEEPLPTGTEESFERRGYEIIRDGDRVELVVDPQGQIYTDRNYQGIIPSLRPYHFPERFRRTQQSVVSWVGFQPMANVSRLFWQVTDAAVPFEITRIDERTVQVFFPNTRHDRRNEIRPMVMSSFDSAISSVEGQRVRGGLRYLIKLRRPVNYLYRVDAPFLFVDFER